MSYSKFFSFSIAGGTPVCFNHVIHLLQKIINCIQEIVSTIGALTTDPNTHGTTHGGQPRTSHHSECSEHSHSEKLHSLTTSLLSSPVILSVQYNKLLHWKEDFKSGRICILLDVMRVKCT
ncbi:hypothetical protein TNIN_351961 [Trichonephila inaurata madagascariensis]|uniref:Uncharacterized protein n=1 Tax=Trichonephila inaurata madagascariensis TaxID=2747483 RepID=A0A8X7BYM4_9ARAC|nr:hypothetical protein TNIN_351961 [Trichonephila inaurata madagascariensis]